jgi:hypothetical protein
MSSEADISAVASYAKRVLPLQSAILSEEYFYQSLPLCVLDAVFSIGVKYESTRQVVIRYSEHTAQRRIRSSTELLQRSEQESVSSFCSRPEQSNPELMAARIYRNRQRTSAQSGILKAEAALRFAQALRTFGVEHFQDVDKVADNSDFEAEILKIPGQRSGISLNYFWMLAGSGDFIKSDRMVIRFLETALAPGSSVEALTLLRGASRLLSVEYPGMTPRLLDHEIWKYQRFR